MTLVALSRWLEACARKSSILQGKSIVCIPNAIDTNFFRPMERAWARQVWNLPQTVPLIGFGAFKSIQNRLKGFEFFTQALGRLDFSDVEAVVLGSSEPENPPKLGMPCHYMGHLHDEISLVMLYNALDVFIFPSLAESLGYTVIEALACGVPVVAFAVGGLVDLIEHKVNGYLARPYEIDDLAKGIRWTLENASNLRMAARQKALQYGEKQVATQYITLYKSLTTNR